MTNISFATFNILNSNFTYLNAESCKKEKVVSYDDEKFRLDIIIKIFEDNDIDVIFLQEVSDFFILEINKSTLKNKYYYILNGELVIFIKKSLVLNYFKVNLNQYVKNIKNKIFIIGRIFAVECLIANNKVLLINCHLPPKILSREKNDSLELIKNLIKNYENHKIIIAGDMNTSNYIDINPSINSIISPMIKRNYATSFKLGNCVNDTFLLRPSKQRSNFIDDIYTSKNISVLKFGISSDFDDKFNLIFENQKSNENNEYGFKLENKAPPYCDPVDYNSTEKCEISNSLNKYTDLFNKHKIKQWPSDHALLFALLKL